MKVQAPEDALGEHALLRCRDHSWKGLLHGAAFFGIIGFVALRPYSETMNVALAFIPLLLSAFLLVAGLYRGFFRDRSWLLIKTKNALLLNPDFSGGHGQSPTLSSVLRLDDSEIESLCLTREVFRVAHRFGATRHHFISLDIHLQEEISTELREHIAVAQENFRNSKKEGPFPLRLEGAKIIRLNWAWISPAENEAEAALEKWYTLRPRREVIFPAWNLLDRELQAFYTIKLWRLGMTREAEFLNRRFLRLSAEDWESIQARLRLSGEEELSAGSPQDLNPVARSAE